ncbi:MAG: SGNH/GDSL hydrolase family protein [Muribaculaceae bacterium]|nr:SGNH/GDSL hydrolase family protein [Muribaculaceae bacterium]
MKNLILKHRLSSLKALLISIFSLLPLSLFAQKTDWAEFSRYEADNKALLESGRPINVVFFGNSITDSWASMRPGFFKGNGFIGRGISGQTTYQFLSRFREDVINLHPRLVVLNGATNDIAENSHPYSEERTIGNIRSMIELARANGIGVILTSTLPAAGFKWNRTITDAPEKIKALNEKLKAMAEEYEIPYVDYHSLLLDSDGRSLRADLSPDGVHPNITGYAIMEEAILPVIKQF